MINQIRAMVALGQPFWVEIASGRVIQIYQPSSVATTENCVGVLWEHGGFEIIGPDSIVAIGSGIHAVERERLEKFKAEFSK